MRRRCVPHRQRSEIVTVSDMLDIAEADEQRTGINAGCRTNTTGIAGT